jgi:hypothetical protein
MKEEVHHAIQEMQNDFRWFLDIASLEGKPAHCFSIIDGCAGPCSRQVKYL